MIMIMIIIIINFNIIIIIVIIIIIIIVVEFLRTLWQGQWERGNSSPCGHVRYETSRQEGSRSGRVVNVKEMYQNIVMHVQCHCFAITNCFTCS